MNRLDRVALIGNHLPRRCGIATFTHDLHNAIGAAAPHLTTSVVAMNDSDQPYGYPPAVSLTVRDTVIADYQRAAAALNTARTQVVSLQHEYGIFGGEAGGHIVELISRLEMPVVTTLHTVLPVPSAAQARVMRRITSISARLVVMSEKGRALLQSSYGVASDKIDVIAHGIPEYPFIEPMQAKAKLGFSGRAVVLTFGLLSPSKGLEAVIDAMPAIVAECPNAVYVVLGATHPNLVRDHGETYRESLTTRVKALGMDAHVVFLDQFVDQPTLLDFISMCDVYVTPYLNEAQMTSGTLAYSFGLGKAVVSTPYWHARELLAGGLGILVPFGDSVALGREVAGLLRNDVRRHAMRKRAYAASRTMTWPQVAKRYVATFESAIEQRRTVLSVARSAHRVQPTVLALPEFRSEHLLSMCDSADLIQHAVHSTPDRHHGYCVDDNARALLLSATLAENSTPGIPDVVTNRFAAFVQHAWNRDNKRFRNFMSYDRRWLEPAGSEDSHARTLWALAACAKSDPQEARCRWADALFREALPAVEGFSSPRSWAFALLALDIHGQRCGDDVAADQLRRVLADRLMARLAANTRKDWVWFEAVLAYDNARLPEALIRTGAATHTPAYTTAGLQTLRWLMDLQVAPAGHFRPVGSHSFGRAYTLPEPFDQQPVEAAAAVSACLAAARHDVSTDWQAAAMSAFNWFLGDNDLRTPLVDQRTGGCMDGLHADRPNRNMGAESVLSYLLSLAELRASRRVSTLHRRRGYAVTQPTFFNRQALYLRPDPTRVVVRPFKPATEPRDFNATDKTRANHIVERVLAMTADAAAAQLAEVLENFDGRHRNLLDVFEARAAEMEDAFTPHALFSKAQRHLIGAYFLHEYSFEASALFNPSIVRHPDQTGAPHGGCRFILSLRAVGEGHISSLTFRSGSIDVDGNVTIDPTARLASVARVTDRTARPEGDDVEVAFKHADDLSERVLFPVTDAQSNGIEDARFVAFEDNGRRTFYATYTAYSGRAIRSELIETTDFRTFRMTPMRGSAVRNKGMSLFPRKIGGRYAMIGRQDNENLYLIYSNDLYTWDGGTAILKPQFPWEFVQIGNCGSPIELDEGWLLFTHGVGPVRKYAIGAALLDKSDPSKVLARSHEPLVRPDPSERAGYVPNVVYTCGAMRHGERIILPYAVSDTFSNFATIKIPRLLEALTA